MTKREFLLELDRSLTGLSYDERKEIISDYIEHFRIGLAEGKSEGEISSALGNPRIIAKSYRVDYLVEQARSDKSAGNIVRAVFAVISLSFFNVIFVLGPFLGLVGALLGLWAGCLALVISGIGAFGAAMLNPLFPHWLPIMSSSQLIGVGLLGAGVTSLGLLVGIGLYYLSLFLYKVTVKYLEFNVKIIRG